MVLRPLERLWYRRLHESSLATVPCYFRHRQSSLIASRTSGKSTQKAFMFMPYRNPAKLSENRARLSCINCSCKKFCSKSAIASLSSAKPSCRPSSALPEAEAARPRCEESRKEDREDARSGVVGRERGDLLRVRLYLGVVVGVVDAIVFWEQSGSACIETG
jgi:hypothetical protein